MNIKFLWQILFIIHCCTAWMDERPVLESVDGNLIISSAKDRNITIKILGNGYFNVDDIDLLNVAASARSASRLVAQWRDGYLQELIEKMRTLLRIIEGPHGLQRRVELLESPSGVLPSGSHQGRPSDGISDVTRSDIRTLTDQIRRVEGRIRTIVSKLRQNQCSSNPCQNGGTCVRIYDGFQCICTSNWEGNNCAKDVNECARFSGTDLGCQNGATCINTLGSYRCKCAVGWYGVDCTSNTEVCNPQDSQQLCGHHGTCVPTGTVRGYSCFCNEGWKSDGDSPACIVDVNECEAKHPPCSVQPFVPCINIPGSFYCGSCPTGYTGNGHYCVDVDECLTDNGGCSKIPKVQCINTLGSRVCGPCPPGYQGDGVTCYFVGTCRVNNGGCHPLATCIENSGYTNVLVECRCPEGYHGNGMGPNGCQPGTGVVIQGPCSSNPCVHGTCIPHGQHFICRCESGFTGTTCDATINPCSPNPCKNKGLCTVSGSTVFCECTAAYTGPRCETAKENCGGVIRDLSGTLTYPSSGETYRHGLSCAIILVTNSSFVLNVTFTKFDLESTPGCNDFLQIHDGGNAGSHQIGRFCGNTLPNGGKIISTHNSLYMWFHTDKSVSRTGFSFHWNSIKPVCGGNLNTEHGTISSPGSPGRYSPDRDCIWNILVRPGKRIQFHFFTVMIEENPTCDKDYLEIKEIVGAREVQLARYCNHTHPPPLVTSGSFAEVHFHSDKFGQDLGFQLTYSSIEGIPGCGGVYTADQGMIVFPTDQTRYEPNMICEWKIQLPVGERIQITWISMDIEKSPTCRFDYVKIYEGPDMESPLVGRFCGEDLPPVRSLDSNVALIVFRSDWSNEREGFRIHYNIQCGGEFHEPTGVIKSPYYPNTYPASRSCVYEIIQPPSKSVILQIVDMGIEGSSYIDCYFDHLEIRDGDNENATLLANLCGNEDSIPSDPFYSSLNYMYLKFESDASIHGHGFMANYTTIDRRCGGILKQATGQIKNPEEYQNYVNDEDCTWTIQAPPGHVIQLSWTKFNLEYHDRCQNDHVKVSEEYNGDDTEIGRYCGAKKPPTITSQGRTMTVVFHTDSSITSDGFTANYIFVDASTMCGGHYFTSNGIIKSPGFPDMYPANRECIWIIEAQNKHHIILSVKKFQLEESGTRNCNFDYLEIRNGGYDTSPLISKYCGNNIPEEIHSFTNQLYIKFYSDSSRGNEGFLIEWDSTTYGCGGTLTGFTGDIVSPFYPQPYSRSSDCTWKIAVAAGSRVQIVIVDLDLEEHIRCHFDFIEISEGINGPKKNINRYCGPTHPTSIDLNSHLVTVRFRSDFTNSGRGFHIKYNTFCRTKIHGFSGVIESPNFPNEYPSPSNCSWIIEAPQGNKVNVTFSHFSLELATNSICTYDYLKISEGSNDKPNTALGIFCNKTLPPKIASAQNQVFIDFIADNYFAYGGFRLEWTINGCGGHLNKPEGHFTSPGYPSPYPNDIECEWLIEVDHRHSVEIFFSEIKMEKTQNCRHDQVQIYGGDDASARKFVEFCYSSEPINYTSPTNKMFIKFKSDHTYAGRGFSANYKAVPLTCGGVFNADEGIIHSANYPMNYPHNQNCEWSIKVDRYHVVNLTFTDFDIEDTTNCTDDHVEVFDGSTRDDISLGRFCKNQLPPSIISSGNILLVVMQTDSLIAAKGFIAIFKRACGARIIANSTGFLTTATNLHLRSTGITNCSWIIVAADPADHITLTIFHMDLDTLNNFGLTDHQCVQHSLKVYEGEGLDGPLRGSWCYNKAPPPIISNGNSLTVHLFSRASSDTASFRASYSVLNSACGGNYYSESGTLSSPLYPESYPMNVECVWTLHTAPGNRLKLIFSEFNIESSPNCDRDYLEIREDSAIGKLIGVFCGNTIDSEITANTKLWMKFQSDNTGTGSGFLAEYSFLHGNDVTGTSGTISSPLYPHPYKSAGEINWRITVDFGYAIKIEFTDFHIEYSDSSNSKGLTSEMFIHDGYDSGAALIASLHGITLPDPIQSTSNVVYIKLQSNLVLEGNWFSFNWYQIPRDFNGKNTDIKSSECNEEIELKDLNNTSHYIMSPGYPHGYKDDLDCNWVITSPPGTHLVLWMITLDIEESDNCIFDYVSVYLGHAVPEPPPSSSRLLGKFCLANESSVRVESTNVMTVKFHSDVFTNKTGFKAIALFKCGGELSGPNGEIEFNDKLRRSLVHAWSFKCEWNVTVRPGRMIEVEVTNITIDSDDKQCGNDYLMLKNGEGPESPLLGKGKYCGQNTIGTLMTTSNKLYVKAVGTDSHVSFQLTYREVGLECGGVFDFTSTEKHFELATPNYPNIPPPYTECFWTFMAPAGERISIHFTERFDLTKSDNCEREYVEIRDGATESSKFLGRYCSDTAPSSMTVDGNVMNIHFYTDVPDPKNGFQATVIAGEFCGGIIRANQGIISSPNYPSEYPINQDCAWWIIGPPDHTIKLQFRDIHLPGLRRCEMMDFVTINEKIPNNDTGYSFDLTVSRIGTYCGSVNPGLIETSINEAVIMFHSNDRKFIRWRGFSLNYTISKDVCGGALTATEGIFKSIGYPYPSIRSRYCEWRITVPDGNQVRVDIDDLELGGTLVGDGAYFLGFYNDFTSRSKITTLRPGEPTTQISSSTNIMLVSYWSSSGHRGLKAHYMAVAPAPCGGVLTDSEGSLMAPTTPPFNQSSFYCQWSMTVPDAIANENTGQTLTVTISGNIGRYRRQTRTCSYLMKHIIVKDPVNPVGMICGNVSAQDPYIVRSPSSVNSIKLLNGTFSSVMKFDMKYKWHACGGRLNGPSHTVQAPNISFPRSCAWNVEFPDNGKVIHMSFNRFNVGNCVNGYVLIRNGGPMSPEIGKFCGNLKPSNISSSSHKLWIEYFASEGPGDFEFRVDIDAGGCGGTMRGSGREIRSPGFPKQYPNNAECIWEIKAETGYHIGLTFVERFNLETSTNCSNDFIEVFDWNNDNSGSWKSIAKMCGRNVPNPMNVTSNRMKVLFRTNEVTQGDGFRAIWDRNCGGIFKATDYRQIIESPNYPHYYDKNLICNYTIIVDEDKSILLEFNNFELERGNGNCKYDNLTIQKYEWGWADSPTIWCGQNKPPVQIGGKFEIIFQTDKFIQKSGFQMAYLTNVCGGEITRQQIIQPPRSKEMTYFGRLNCTWVIRAPEDKTIALRFSMFELEYTYSCYGDYVTIYEGTNIDTSQLLATFCGNLTDSLPMIKSTGNTMTVSFNSNDYDHFKGFATAVVFTKSPASGCGGNISLKSSLTWKSQKKTTYESFEDCLWTVSVPSNQIIRMTIRNLDVRNTPNKTATPDTAPCNGDYLEVRDGIGPLAELIGRYCGSTVPPAITSLRNNLWIRFVSDGEIEGTGVTANLEPIASSCGDLIVRIIDKAQILTSPDYPNNYPLGTQCKWKVIAPTSYNIHIHFVNVDMEDSADCDGDRLQIIDQANSQYISQDFGESFIYSGKRPKHFRTRLGRFNPVAPYTYCSKLETHDYYSGSNEVEINLKTTMQHPMKPRKFKLSVGLANCTRNYTSSQGRIYHQGFSDCWITITVPAGNTISLYFNNMRLFDMTECTNSYLQVHDGDFSAPLLATLCGMEVPSPIFSSNNKLSLHSKSERGVTWEHYDITYTSTDKGRGCGGNIFNYGGRFTSPLYPNNYRNESQCIWEVSVPRGFKIVLNFELFDLGTSDCGTDYLEITETLRDSIHTSRYCSTDIPAKFHGSINSVSVTYVTSANNGGNGWVITFIGVEHTHAEEDISFEPDYTMRID